MKLKQLSVFLENKPGALSAPCRRLAQAGVNLLTLCLADTREFGILRLVVRDWEKARQTLEAGGWAVRLTEVVAVEVPDRPGGLAAILDALEGTGINLEYAYAFTCKAKGHGLLVFRFSDPDGALKALQARKISAVGKAELFKRLKN